MKKLIHFNLLLALLLLLGNQNFIKAQCTISGLNANYCTNSPTSALTPGLSGGNFSGPGITGSTFDPSIAGPGTHTINYNICSATYSITTETFAPQPTVGTAISLGDDATTAALPIGFNFQFFCNSYTNFYVCSNGFLTFNAGQGNPWTPVPLPSTAAPLNMIGFPWADFDSNYGGAMTYTTTGTAPNRKLVISFTGIAHHNTGLGATTPNPATMQLILYETTNIIEVHTTLMPYNYGNSGGVPSNHMMGIQNLTGSAAYVVTGRNATTYSVANECMRWTPGASCAVSQTTSVSPSTISVAGNNSICVGTTATLTATGNTTYTWNTASNSNSITDTPTSTQSYSVSGTNSFGCIANSVITVTVDNTPTVTATSSNGTGGVCPGKTLTVNGAGATSYTWTGATPTITDGVAFAPPASAIYTVTGGNACGTATAALSVSIHPSPSVTPVSSTPSLCSGNSVTLTGVGDATLYTWSGGAGSITDGAGFSPILTATYTVIGTSALSCTASATIPVTVVSTPSLIPTAQPPLICIGNSSTLTATGATSYTWTDGTTSGTTATFVATPTSSGISTYTVMRANSTCTTSQQISVITNPLPTLFAIVAPTLVCALNPATLAVGGGQSYTWTSPGNPPATPSFTFSGPGPVVYPPVSTTYTVAASDGTCVNTTTVALATNPNPTLTLSPSVPMICSGQSVGINVIGGNNYTWTATSGTFYTSSISDSPTISTVYNLTGDNSFGCTTQSSQVILVNPNPTVTATANKTLVCSGGPSTLTAGGANTYVWDNSAVTHTTIVNPTNTTSGPVVFTVTGTYSATGCHSTKTVQVSVFIPTITVTGNTNTCSGGPINLNASGGTGNNYTWYVPGNPPYNFATLNTSITAAGIFTVTAITSSLTVSCPGTQTVEVGIYYNPTITATPQRTAICTKEMVVLTATGGVTYLWSNNTGGQTISVNPSSTAVYTVTGTDANGCVNTGTVQVKVLGCAGMSELGIAGSGLSIYPNPNNGEFYIQAATPLDLMLVNELGQLVRTITLAGSGDHGDYKVSIGDLAKGIYFITGQKDGTAISQKIIVTH